MFNQYYHSFTIRTLSSHNLFITSYYNHIKLPLISFHFIFSSRHRYSSTPSRLFLPSSHLPTLLPIPLHALPQLPLFHKTNPPPLSQAEKAEKASAKAAPSATARSSATTSRVSLSPPSAVSPAVAASSVSLPVSSSPVTSFCFSARIRNNRVFLGV